MGVVIIHTLISTSLGSHPPLLLHQLLIAFLRGGYLLRGTWLLHELPHLVHANTSRVLSDVANRRHQILVGERFMPAVSVLVGLLTNGSVPIAASPHAGVEDMGLAPARCYPV